jgi:hypothetical protein
LQPSPAFEDAYQRVFLDETPCKRLFAMTNIKLKTPEFVQFCVLGKEEPHRNDITSVGLGSKNNQIRYNSDSQHCKSDETFCFFELT